ncbi:MAG: hypothetical protein ACK56F_28950, partial [bacterium]
AHVPFVPSLFFKVNFCRIVPASGESQHCSLLVAGRKSGERKCGWMSAGARHSPSGVVSGATVGLPAVALVISNASRPRRTIFPRVGASERRAAS